MFTELVEFLLEGGLFRLGLSHFRTDFTDFRVQSSAEHDSASLSRGDISAGKLKSNLSLSKISSKFSLAFENLKSTFRFVPPIANIR